MPTSRSIDQKTLELWKKCGEDIEKFAVSRRVSVIKARETIDALFRRVKKRDALLGVSELGQQPAVRFPDKKRPITDFLQLLEHGATTSAYRDSSEYSQLRGTVDFTEWGDVPICIMQMTDVHVGSPQCDYRKLVEHIALLREISNLYCIMSGDFIEGKANSRHMDATLSQVFPPQMQARVRTQMFKYLWDKVIVDVSGNHDLYPYLYGGIDVNEFMDRGGIWLRDGGKIIVKMKGVEYSILVLHGDGVPGNSMYDKAAALDRAQRMQFGWHDVALIGHTHDAQIKIKEEPISSEGRGTVVVCRGGTYKTLGSEMFADRLGLAKPARVHMPGVILFPNKKRVLPFLDIEDAVEVLRGLTPRVKPKKAVRRGRR